MTRIGTLAAGIAGILALPLAWWVRTWDSFATVRDICPRLFCDFSDYYYPMGEALFGTGLPVDGFLYSPFIAILLAVFAPLGHEASFVAWGALQFAAVCLYFFLFPRVVAAGLPGHLLFIALGLSTYPLLVNLMGGQVSVFTMVPLLGMLVLYERGRRVGAAALLALAVSFKFYPAIFLWLFVARRDVRGFVYGAAACATVLLVVPGLFLGVGDTLGFYGGLLEAFRDSGWVVTNPHSQFFPHVVLRMVGEEAPLTLLGLVSYAIAAANLGLVYVVQRARLRHADLWSFNILLLTTPFFLKTSWPHDFVFLPFTQAFVAWRLLKGETAKTLTLPLLLISIVFANVVFFDRFAFVAYGTLAILFWANLCLLIVSYVVVVPAVMQRLREADSATESEARSHA